MKRRIENGLAEVFMYLFTFSHDLPGIMAVMSTCAVFRLCQSHIKLLFSYVTSVLYNDFPNSRCTFVYWLFLELSHV